MTDGEALFAAILATPADDTVRLVLADWLQENGQPDRAEFIRVQIRMSRWPDRRPHPRCRDGREPAPHGYGLAGYADRCRCPWCTIGRREYLVSRRHIREWEYEALAPLVDDEAGRRRRLQSDHAWPMAYFRRGLVGSLAVAAEDLVAHAAELFRRSPVEQVWLIGNTPQGFGGHPAHEAIPEGRFGWGNREAAPFTGPYLPAPLFDLLAGHASRTHLRHLKLYPTHEAAVEAASVACVRFGRSRAGLPRLRA